MHPEVLIIGQGLAGTLLAWELERSDIGFAIVDAGVTTSASRGAAGMINPVTGRRLVKSVRVDEFLPLARSVYQEMERELGVSLWRDFRVRRTFADDRERHVVEQKAATGELAPYLGAIDETAAWIERAAQLDVPVLLDALGQRWQQRGRLRRGRGSAAMAAKEHDLVIDCSGVGKDACFDFVPWRFSKGEILEISAMNLDPGTILNSGRWVLPLRDNCALVGATHEPDVTDTMPTSAARAELEQAATKLIGRPFKVTNQWAGTRVSLPDKLPVIGRHPANPRLGLMNGLGAKGVLWAPALAQSWVRHLQTGASFDPMFDLSRFGGS